MRGQSKGRLDVASNCGNSAAISRVGAASAQRRSRYAATATWISMHLHDLAEIVRWSAAERGNWLVHHAIGLMTKMTLFVHTSIRCPETGSNVLAPGFPETARIFPCST